jgi:AraC-like DNA-binding protein
MFTADAFIVNLRQIICIVNLRQLINRETIVQLLVATKQIPPTRHLAQGLNPVVNYLEEFGVSPSTLLTQAKVPASVLHNPTHHLTTDQELRFLELAIKTLGQPDLGLTLGSKYHLSAYGILGLAIMTSANLLDGAKVLFKNILMTWTYMHWSISVKDGKAVIAEQPLRDLGNCEQYMIDRGMIAVYLIFSEALGRPIKLHEIHLTQEKPDYADKYQQFFNCPIKFGQRMNSCIFDEADLYEPLPQSDPDSSLIFQKQCESTCHKLGDKFCFSDLVRQHILAQDSSECTLERIAEKLHLTPRSVQRKLSAEDTSFKVIQENVRCSLAIEYLETTDLVIEEIASHLGYNEASSFCHAFKRWTGKPPRAYRQ